MRSPRWVIWITNPEEDKLLERPSSVEVITTDEEHRDEWLHESFLMDRESGSYQELLNDERWGKGNHEILRGAIDASTAEWNELEQEGAKEMAEFRQWKDQNKTLVTPDHEIIEKEVIKETKQPFKLNVLELVSSEEIFKLKLDMFEKEFVQNADREVKAAIRKSSSIFELVSLYHSLIPSP